MVTNMPRLPAGYKFVVRKHRPEGIYAPMYSHRDAVGLSPHLTHEVVLKRGFKTLAVEPVQILLSRYDGRTNAKIDFDVSTESIALAARKAYGLYKVKRKRDRERAVRDAEQAARMVEAAKFEGPYPPMRLDSFGRDK